MACKTAALLGFAKANGLFLRPIWVFATRMMAGEGKSRRVGMVRVWWRRQLIRKGHKKTLGGAPKVYNVRWD